MDGRRIEILLAQRLDSALQGRVWGRLGSVASRSKHQVVLAVERPGVQTATRNLLAAQGVDAVPDQLARDHVGFSPQVLQRLRLTLRLRWQLQSTRTQGSHRIDCLMHDGSITRYHSSRVEVSMP